MPFGDNGVFGTDPAIGLENPDQIKILYKAEFKEVICCPGILECCYYDAYRQYYFVLENAYESNTPGPLGRTFCVQYCPPFCHEVMCPGIDFVCKTYYDRGIYDQRDWCHRCGCMKGEPRLWDGNAVCMLCCMEMPPWFNQLIQCYFPSICGDRVLVVPCEQYCCGCCRNEATYCSNYCGLCGPKDGTPLIVSYFPLVSCLKENTGAKLVEAQNEARRKWLAKQNTN